MRSSGFVPSSPAHRAPPRRGLARTGENGLLETAVLERLSGGAPQLFGLPGVDQGDRASTEAGPGSLAPSAPPASASSTKASSSRVEISKSSRMEAWEAYIRRPTSWKSPALSARTASITRAFSVTMCLARSSSSPEAP